MAAAADLKSNNAPLVYLTQDRGETITRNRYRARTLRASHKFLPFSDLKQNQKAGFPVRRKPPDLAKTAG